MSEGMTSSELVPLGVTGNKEVWRRAPWPQPVSAPTGTLPLASQESAVVEDLLYVLVGVDGRYITAQPLTGRQSRTFLVDPNLDLSIRELVNRILPVAASYSTVTR